MPKKSKYTPDELENRLQEIASGTGKPYELGEDPAVDAAMRVKNTGSPLLDEDKMRAIGAGILLAAAQQLPTLSNKAFNQIEAKLQTQAQLQSAPKPSMSDEAFNRIETELRLRSAPKPALSDEALLRIEQNLLQAAKPSALIISIAAFILTLFGVMLAITVLFNDNTSEATPIVEDISEAVDTQIVAEPTSEYSTGIEVAFITVETETVEPTPEIVPTEIPPTAEPIPPTDVVEEFEPEPVIIPSIHDVLALPPTLVIEGSIESLETETLTIYGLVFTFAHDTTLIEGYSIGDTVYIEGSGNPYDTATYLILSIEPVIDIVVDRPVLISLDTDPPTTDDTTTTGIFTDVGTSDTGDAITGTSGTTLPTVDGDTRTSDEDGCEDGDDANQGRGQECNQGGGRGRP